MNFAGFAGIGVLMAGGYVLADEALHSQKAGKCEIVLLSDGQSEGNAGILIGATEEMLAKYAGNGSYPTACNAFLVKTPEKVVLVDTGTGRKIEGNLRAAGVSPERVDAILLTHMHGDHIGGMVKDGAAVFPNAKVYVSQQEYDYWMSDDEMNAKSEDARGNFNMVRNMVGAYKDRLKIFNPCKNDMNKTFFPEFRAIAAFGHTPGHTMYMLESDQERLLFWGDIAHAMAVQMPFPQVAVTYDVDPARAVASREKTLKYVSQQGIEIAGMHIAFPAMGKVERDGKGYRFTPVKVSADNAAK